MAVIKICAVLGSWFFGSLRACLRFASLQNGFGSLPNELFAEGLHGIHVLGDWVTSQIGTFGKPKRVCDRRSTRNGRFGWMSPLGLYNIKRDSRFTQSLSLGFLLPLRKHCTGAPVPNGGGRTSTAAVFKKGSTSIVHKILRTNHVVSSREAATKIQLKKMNRALNFSVKSCRVVFQIFQCWYKYVGCK